MTLPCIPSKKLVLHQDKKMASSFKPAKLLREAGSQNTRAIQTALNTRAEWTTMFSVSLQKKVADKKVNEAADRRSQTLYRSFAQ